ncbi:uncharacterized protein (TIGR02266 family) [Geothermobacter ehrlichii]|uniref:Uncharacterized protein (TIGR02266 family) n=1 Tax=Geothermobacter ehrlichii TaxID=213224 RepID=A0A5D3WJM1_9BACT|nr:HD domain-containing phosphohydrolase [Geothermobacter ehrlichii]TYO98247.1 uncharacterized protein (TIGR02266 family) [Geothermobacter ehrlichii]
MPPLNEPPIDFSEPLRHCLDYLGRSDVSVPIQSLLTASGIDRERLRVTAEQFYRFCQHVAAATGDDMLLRRVGRHAGRRASLGFLSQAAQGIVGPGLLLQHLIRRHQSGRPALWELKKTGARRLELSLGGKGHGPFLCQYVTGFLEGLAPLYSQEGSGFVHPRCTGRGDSRCLYVLSWPNRPGDTLRRARNLLAAGTLLTLPAIPWIPATATGPLAFAAMGGLFALTAIGGIIERIGIQKHLHRQILTNEHLVDQENANAVKLQLTRELSQAVGSRGSSEDLLQAVIDILAENLDFDRGMIFLVDRDEKTVQYRAGFGLGEQDLAVLREPVSMDLKSRGHPLPDFLRQSGSLLVNDVRGLHSVRHHNFCRWMAHLGNRSFLCCPIHNGKHPAGLLIMGLSSPRRQLLESDLQLLEGLVPLIGIGLQNTRLLHQQSSQFQSILQVLAASIDARDFLTAGHSAQVTEYAVGICRKLGLSEDYTDMVRIAAMLHDYGKLAVPDFILKKDGELSAEEKALIRTHPDKSREILERIPFEGIYRQIPQIVGAHHEKMDGSGYPKGLKGEEIPLGARIIAVADFFEAITSKRHYRDPMPYPVALQLLAEESLIHFDKNVVDAFFRYINETRVCMVGRSRPKRTSIDRRKVRIPCRTHVSCQIGNRVVAGTSANLSSGGIFVATDHPIDVNNHVEVIFTLPNQPSTLFRLKGRVAWHNNRKAQRLPHGVGIEFLRVPEEISGALNGFISHYVARHEAGLADEPVLTVH